MYNSKGVFRKEDFMLIDLNEILSETGKEKQYKAPIEKDFFTVNNESYNYNKKSDVLFKIVNKGKKVIKVDADIDIELIMPCGRCLEDVIVPLKQTVSKDIDLKKTAQEREDDIEEDVFLNGMNLDTEVFIDNEIFVNLPMKVLCKEDCKGICYKCGTNLNTGSCDCDTTELDPRMSKILDVFNQFKEV